MYQCFIFLSQGIGIERNIKQSIPYLQSAGENNFLPSFIINGFIFLEGKFVEQNEEKAVSYFQRSANYHETKGKFWFGFCLIEGKGIRKSFYRGLELIQQANEDNDFLANLYLSIVLPFRSKFK
jgi:TPR repeat protein